MPTCIWVFRLSLVSAFVCMASAPYIGMHTAKQRIAELALWGSLNTIFAFSLAYYLTKYKGDTLLAYSVGLVGITIIFQMVQVFRARCMFPECRIKVRYLYDKARLRQVLSFSGWRLFGSLGAMLRNQGTAILLNKYFSPVSYPYVNASYSVANNVSSYTQTLSTALLGAFTPEITATEGRGDRERVLVQASRASKFGTYLILLFAIPLMFEIDYVLVIWLKNPPQLAGIFCRLILTMFIIDKITFGQQVAVSAKGDIAGYQMTVGGCLLLTLPIAWLFLHLGYGATSVGWAFLITFFFCSAGRLFWARYLVGLSVVAWIRIVFFPCVTVLLAGVSIGVLIQSVWIQASFFRFCTLTASTVTSSLLLGWMIVLNEPEKFVVKGGLLRIVNRITKSIFACLAGRS
ncbi:MAG: hypothetical protein PF904_17090 [Kiritimatiellae bacterium]|nr:hypothetical protein [Kiritimatiellia bacterium]